MNQLLRLPLLKYTHTEKKEIIIIITTTIIIIIKRKAVPPSLFKKKKDSCNTPDGASQLMVNWVLIYILIKFVKTVLFHQTLITVLLVWMLTRVEAIDAIQIETIQKEALHLIINTYENTYKDLLNKIEKPNMNTRRISVLRFIKL